jgi:hypothetical protein
MNAGSRWKCGDVGDGAGNDWVSEEVKKAVRLEHGEEHKGKGAHQSSTEIVTRDARRGEHQKHWGNGHLRKENCLG